MSLDNKLSTLTWLWSWYTVQQWSSPARKGSDLFLELKSEPISCLHIEAGFRIRRAIPRTPLRTFFLNTATVVKCPSGCRFWWDKSAVFDRKIKERPLIFYLLHFVNRLNPFAEGCTTLKLLRTYFKLFKMLLINTRVGTLIVATIYLQLIQNRYMFRSFTLLQCSHQHCVQPVASNVEVVGYL